VLFPPGDGINALAAGWDARKLTAESEILTEEIKFLTEEFKKLTEEIKILTEESQRPAPSLRIGIWICLDDDLQYIPPELLTTKVSCPCP